jgi:cytochrome P450
VAELPNLWRVYLSTATQSLLTTRCAGRKFRATPDTVLFRSVEAHGDIYNSKANVRRSNFYEAWIRDENHSNTMNTVDVEKHARKRRLLNLAFTEQSVKAAGPIMSEHIDRWNQVLVTKTDEDGWSVPRDMSTWIDYLVFDAIGDLCFGENFKTKEEVANPYREIPHTLMGYVKAGYPVCSQTE